MHLLAPLGVAPAPAGEPKGIRRGLLPTFVVLAAVSSSVLLTACGHSQPEKDYGGTQGGGSLPPSSGKGRAGAGGDGGAGGGAGAGGSGGGFATTAACQAIEARFDAAFPKMLYCNTKDANPCNINAFKDRIVCGCPAYISAADVLSAVALQTAQSDWNASTCGNQVTCPPLNCPPATKGVCIADFGSTVGTCETQ